MPTTAEKDAELAASREAVMEAYDKLMEAKDHFKQAAEAAGIELKQDAADQLLKGRRKAEEVGKAAQTYVEEKPMMAFGLAFLAGFIFAHLFSRK